MSKLFIEEQTLTAIGNSIREKTGKTDLIAPGDMPSEITSITTGGSGGIALPEEALVITGDCSYRFANGGWDWFINTYGNQITTSNITSASNMFYNARELKNISFEINMSNTATNISTEYMFNSCKNLESIPKINGGKVGTMNSMFFLCHKLRNLPDDIADWFDWSYMENQTSGYSCGRNQIFHNCFSLRSFPMNFLSHANKYSGYYQSYFYSGFTACCCLDELINLPIPYIATWTDNAFYCTFNLCSRLKNIKFALQEDGAPYVMKWKSQTIDLSNYLGYSDVPYGILNYNSGITADKEVTNDATYQALKDDPDWFTSKPEYSRYNYDSAAATINSLPDTSAYLATAGGTNTIKFKNNAGSATDGGAINAENLAASIAEAAAKGWTVAFS